MICGKCGFEYTSEKCPVCEADIQPAHIEKKKSKLGLIGLIVSIASFVINFFVPVGIPELYIAIAGLICSIVGKKKNSDDACATWGIVISIIKIVLEIIMKIVGTIVGILVSILYIIFYYVVYFGMDSFISNMGSFM